MKDFIICVGLGFVKTILVLSVIMDIDFISSLPLDYPTAKLFFILWAFSSLVVYIFYKGGN